MKAAAATAVCAVLLVCDCGAKLPLPNGLGRLPPLGWNSWATGGSAFQNASIGHTLHDVCNESEVKSVAAAMISQGLHSAGYTMINLDDCWEATTRSSDGQMRPDPMRFPSSASTGSFKPLADWLHAKGFTFGIYTSAGNQTCSTGGRVVPGNPHARGVDGSLGHYKQDAQTFSRWGVDYVKFDWCTHSGPRPYLENYQLYTTKFRTALDATGHPFWLSFHCGDTQGNKQPYEPWCAQVGQSWRIAKDHHDNWNSTATIIETLGSVNAASNWTTGPQQWPDADFLMTGGAGCDSAVPALRCPGQTEVEYRTEFSLWALAASQIIVATDLRELTPFMKSVLLHDEMLAIHQDSLAAPGGRVSKQGLSEVWRRPLAGSDVAIGLFNGAEATTSISFNVSDVFSRCAEGVRTRNVWQRKELGRQQGVLSLTVHSHQTIVLRLFNCSAK